MSSMAKTPFPPNEVGGRVTTVDLPENPDDVQEDPRSSREMDTELRTIGRMLRMLEQQEPDARSRIVTYLSSRFPVTIPS